MKSPKFNAIRMSIKFKSPRSRHGLQKAWDKCGLMVAKAKADRKNSRALTNNQE